MLIDRSDTIAAFTDSIWGGAFFETAEPEFYIETSTDGTAYSSHPVGGPDGPLVFSPSASLVPGGTSYAGLLMRTGTTSPAAQVEMQAASTTDALLDPFVTFSARLSDPSRDNCADAFVGAGDPILVPQNSELTSIPTPAPTWKLAGLGTVPVKLCFEFRLSSNAATQAPTGNGTSVEPTWVFTALPVAETP
ncbi:hypothetical protein [Dietzia aurantiaca]|uniref:Uncharacterized protein n=1 Tax=Dietzia aurantiaca TaxID=983873 RepID=A0ABV9PTJ6_9ACTN